MDIPDPARRSSAMPSEITLLAGQKRVLEMVATGAPLSETLAELIRIIEAEEAGLRCGILLVTEDGAHFRRGCGPTLPEAYHQALDGVPITPPYLGPCGQSAHQGVPVIVSDVAQDTRWAAPWRHLVLSAGLASCRSTPVFASDGKVLASFAMYYDRARDPHPANPQLIEIAAWLAGIAIERDRSVAVLRASEERLAVELAAAQRLQEISTQLIREGNADSLYGPILDVATDLMHADMASMQRLDPQRNELQLLAGKGSPPEAASFWEWVRLDSNSTCGAAFKKGQRVVVPDIEACDFVAATPEHDAYRSMGVRAAQSTPLFSRSGRLLGMISTHWRTPYQPSDRDFRLFDVLARQVADLIERGEAEAALRRSEERLRIALGAGKFGHWELDLATLSMTCSDQCKANFGRPAAEPFTYAMFLAAIHPEDRDMVQTAVDRAIAERGDYEAEYRCVWPDGSIHWINARGRALADGPGPATRMVGVTLETTGRKRAEAALRELNESLEQRVAARTRELEVAMEERRKTEAALQQAQRLEAIGQLTGGVAHDFNNLLTVVLGQAENIIRAAPDNERIQRMAGALRRAAEQGAQLTGQLLAFARHQQLHVESISVRRLVANVCALLRRAAGETIVLEIGAEARLWPSRIDAAQFESALLNLVINARDAMPQGGRIAIKARNTAVSLAEAQRLDLAPGDYVLVSVADSGCGMPPEVLRRCFEPFFTTKDIGKGTGLGLAQIYGFARQSGGTATIDSTVGQGTTVSLYLPRAAAAVTGRHPDGAGTASAEGQGRTILVVEDRPDVRETIATSLDDKGYRTVTAPDGVEARKMLENGQSVDLLLTDIVMPNGISGIELARAARRLRHDLKIVLMSGFDRDMHRRVGETEAFVFVRKPFREADLAAAIASAFGRGNRPG